MSEEGKPKEGLEDQIALFDRVIIGASDSAVGQPVEGGNWAVYNALTASPIHSESRLESPQHSYVNGDGTATLVGSTFFGAGVPAVGLGNNGDLYFRSDGGAGTTIYQKRAGAWVATAA